MRVVFLSPALVPGGAEHSLLVYLEHLDRARFEPHLALCNRVGRLLERVPADVPVHDLRRPRRFGLGPSVWSMYRLGRRLRPDVVVSFLWYCDALQLLARRLPGASWRAVATLHIPSQGIAQESHGRTKLALLAALYPRADACLAVSDHVAQDCRERFVPRGPAAVHTQHNPHPLAEIRRRAAEDPPPYWPAETAHRLVAVGRLEPQKGYDVLLAALARLPRELDWHLAVLGAGSEAAHLAQLAAELGVARRITWAGDVANPFAAMRAAHLLVLASRSEGLPGVLVEAQAVGVAVVATDCPGGTAEVLGHGTYGRLVPPEDPAALADELARLLRHPDELAEWRARAASGASRFDAPVVVRAFEERLLSIAAGSR